MKQELKGQPLADAFAKHMNKLIPGVWAHYEGGGWITLRGEGLKPHRDLRKQYPNGWSLLQHCRASEVRFMLKKGL